MHYFVRFLRRAPNDEYISNLRMADCLWSAQAAGWAKLLKQRGIKHHSYVLTKEPKPLPPKAWVENGIPPLPDKCGRCGSEQMGYNEENVIKCGACYATFFVPRVRFSPNIIPMPERPEQASQCQRSLYKCPYGSERCGEGAIYCARCDEDYERFSFSLSCMELICDVCRQRDAIGYIEGPGDRYNITVCCQECAGDNNVTPFRKSE